ncbi:MAG: hypothetical protein FJ319_01370 [SAR202 cluster bacterium]|nr:hypothetical protein [SAR202 cluster bacterium]
MADEARRREPTGSQRSQDEGRKDTFDVYTDQFTITLTPFGANLSFGVRDAHPTQGQPARTEQHGTVRMSVEHRKVTVMIIRRQVMKVEMQTGIKAEVPRDVLNQFHISPKDWDQFWK